MHDERKFIGRCQWQNGVKYLESNPGICEAIKMLFRSNTTFFHSSNLCVHYMPASIYMLICVLFWHVMPGVLFLTHRFHSFHIEFFFLFSLSFAFDEVGEISICLHVLSSDVRAWDRNVYLVDAFWCFALLWFYIFIIVIACDLIFYVNKFSTLQIPMPYVLFFHMTHTTQNIQTDIRMMASWQTEDRRKKNTK